MWAQDPPSWAFLIAAMRREASGLAAAGLRGAGGGVATRHQHHLGTMGIRVEEQRNNSGVLFVQSRGWLVAMVFGHGEGVEFLETFSPFPSVIGVRPLAAIACSLGLDLWHGDVDRGGVCAVHAHGRGVCSFSARSRCFQWQGRASCPQFVRAAPGFPDLASSLGAWHVWPWICALQI